jgi:hypothetical protein
MATPTFNYDAAFSAIRIRNTRSRHQDTLWIKVSVSVDDKVWEQLPGTAPELETRMTVTTMALEMQAPV